MRGMSILLMYLPRFCQIAFEDFDDLISILMTHAGILNLAKRMYVKLKDDQAYYDLGSRDDSWNDGDSGDEPRSLRLLLLGSSNAHGYDSGYNSEQSSGKRKRTESRPSRSRKRQAASSSTETPTRFPLMQSMPAPYSIDWELSSPGAENCDRECSQQSTEDRLLFTEYAENVRPTQEPLDLLLTAAQYASQGTYSSRTQEKANEIRKSHSPLSRFCSNRHP